MLCKHSCEVIRIQTASCGWEGTKQKGGGAEETEAKRCVFKNHEIENKQNDFELEKSVDGYKLPSERETASTLTTSQFDCTSIRLW